MQSSETALKTLEPTIERSPEWSLRGNISPVSISPLYKLGLAAVALGMVLLPILYLAIIAATAYAVYDHALDPWFHFERPGTVALLAYIAPIIIGTILVFFMIKPLFARRVKLAEPVPVLPEDEPELFRFIEAICDVVKASRPRRVQFDLQVNASASFRRGLLSLFGRDLTLTIGLPLVAGLNVREFGGVLAHEFGHFAQGAGMRLTFVVRSLNAWFARLVYERDAWDDRLRDTAGRIDVRIGLILQLARGMIWLTRRILWALMMIGHGISSFMLRQMEFDADRFETQVAGSEAFSATTRRLQLLTVAWQRSIAHQQETFMTKRLVDDLPGLVALEIKRLPDEIEEQLEQALRSTKTGWFDTHPSSRDRIAASEAMAAAGMLKGDAPAAVLFCDFVHTAQQRTAAYYQDDCGVELKDISLHPLEQMSSEAEAAAAEEKCVAQWFGPLLTMRTVMVLTPEDLAATPEAPMPLDIVEPERQTLLLREAKPSVEALLKADGEELFARNAMALLEAGFVIRKKEFGLKQASLEGADEVIAAAKARIEEERRKLDPAMAATRSRIANALRVYRSGSDPEAMAQMERLIAVLAPFGQIAETLLELRNATGGLELLLANSANVPNSNLWNIAARERTESIERATAAILTALGGFDYPFTHARGVVPLSEFLVESEPHPERIPRAFLRGSAVLQRTFALHYRIVSRLAVLAQAAESLREAEVFKGN